MENLSEQLARNCNDCSGLILQPYTEWDAIQVACCRVLTSRSPTAVILVYLQTWSEVCWNYAGQLWRDRWRLLCLIGSCMCRQYHSRGEIKSGKVRQKEENACSSDRLATAISLCMQQLYRELPFKNWLFHRQSWLFNIQLSPQTLHLLSN